MSTATSAPAVNGFTVSNWRDYEKNTLLGFFSLELPSGMVLHGWSFHANDKSRWISPPSKEYPKGKWTPILEIPDEAKRAKFQEQAVAAVDAFLTARRQG